MATNFFTRFRKLIPTYPLMVGAVESVDGTNIRVVDMSGGRTTVIGTATVNQRVYYRNGVIEGTAPDLPFVTVEE